MHEVKNKNANSLGIYDMSGNVSEWCWDRYSSSITTSTPATGAASSANSVRVARGGYYNSFGYQVNLSDNSARKEYSPSNYGGYLGFRVVRNAN